MSQEWYYTAAFIVACLSSGRMVRILTNDDFPPVVWLRDKWLVVTKGGEWSKIVQCLWCAAPYIVAVVLAWGWLSHLHWTWWVFNLWMAVSYVASWLVFHDEDGFSQK